MKYIYHSLCRFVCAVCLSLACGMGLSGCEVVAVSVAMSALSDVENALREPLPDESRIIYTPKESRNLGFTTLQGSSLGSNPAEDKSKICFASFFDSQKLAFPVYFEYNPRLNSEGKYSASQTKAQGSFGEMRRKGGFCVEVASGYSLSLFTLNKKPSYIVFVPAAGATYCIRGEAPSSTHLNLSVSTRAHCEMFFATMKKKKK